MILERDEVRRGQTNPVHIHLSLPGGCSIAVRCMAGCRRKDTNLFKPDNKCQKEQVNEQ